MFNSAPQDPQVVFLHGSVSHYTDKNLMDEVQSLDRVLVEMLRPVLRDHPIIVVGYRGAEASVVQDLFLSAARPNGFLHGVYWCVLQEEQTAALPPLVLQFAEAIGTNFQLVPISGFDDLFEKDLLASMTAAGARPTRRSSGHSVAGMPADMRPLEGFLIVEFEQPLLQARLVQYAKRTDLWTRIHRCDLDRRDDGPAGPRATGRVRQSPDACRMAAVRRQSFCTICAGARGVRGDWPCLLAQKPVRRGYRVGAVGRNRQ